MSTVLMWFRRDLRLADNVALHHALKSGAMVIPVYIYSPDADGDWPPGAASRWWLHRSLTALSESIERLGSRLIVRTGPEAESLPALVRETGATAVFFNRLYEPARARADRKIEAQLRLLGIDVITGTGHLLVEPDSVRSQSGTPYRVFTPYYRRVMAALQVPKALPAPRALPPSPAPLLSLPIDALRLLPRINWHQTMDQCWQPGEAGARRKLRELDRKLANYATDRDRPGEDGTSRLSPHLRFGELSPRQVWHRLQRARSEPGHMRGLESLERELLWREFAHHVLHHHPATPDQPLDARFHGFDWQQPNRLVRAWQQGRTGIPIVDAGMRELWATGFMHNRVRMIVASFLTKHIRADWRVGARWFWDTLVDADLASNTLNWQWVAGCGADAAPYFRIFNPLLQSRKFDPHGRYLRRWLPELAHLPDHSIHAPHEARAALPKIRPLENDNAYPVPVLDLATARSAALDAFAQLKRRSGEPRKAARHH